MMLQIQCEDVWFLRQIRKLLARIQAHKKGGGGEATMANFNDSAAEMAVRKKIIESQVRGIGTDVGIVSRFFRMFQIIVISRKIQLDLTIRITINNDVPSMTFYSAIRRLLNWTNDELQQNQLPIHFSPPTFFIFANFREGLKGRIVAV